MSDFMQRQIEISHELVRLMNREHEERSTMFQHLQSQLDAKDRVIQKLEATIEAMQVLSHGK
jgi:hypothetical protein